jgi:hypothetical protein
MRILLLDLIFSFSEGEFLVYQIKAQQQIQELSKIQVNTAKVFDEFSYLNFISSLFFHAIGTVHGVELNWHVSVLLTNHLGSYTTGNPYIYVLLLHDYLL